MHQDKFKEYFALSDGETLSQKLSERLTNYRSRISTSGLEDKWASSFDLYYGRHFKTGFRTPGSGISNLGQQGEMKGVPVNHYRNFIRHVHVMSTSQRPAFDALATNSDPKALLQARLANQVLDYYLFHKKIGEYLKRAGEQALVFGKGFMAVLWEPSLGRAYSTTEVGMNEDGTPITKTVYEGDIDVFNPNPYQVLTDEAETDYRRSQWVAFTILKNKYDLAKRFPDKAEEILSIQSVREKLKYYYMGATLADEVSDALIEVVHFYHKRTEAVPNGRFQLSCGEGSIVLYDDATPYGDHLPVFRIVPGEIIGTVEGYTDAFDLIALQEVYNTLFSTIFTNQQANGVNIIAVPEGSNLAVSQISKGLALLKVPPGGEPKAISLVNTAGEIFKMLEYTERVMETISGVNSVSRGNPDPSLKSGIALQTVQSMTTQFVSGFQESWASLLEESGTFMVWLLKNFAKTKRIMAIAGKSNQSSISEWSGDDLNLIDTVKVQVGNPMQRSLAGRLEMANALLDKGLIKTPQEFFTVMNTGNLEPMYLAEQTELDLIRRENEDMMAGKPTRAIIGDTHVLHIKEHMTVTKDPELRRKAAAGDQAALQTIQAALMHVQDHINLYSGQNPVWNIVSGDPPVPPAMDMLPPGAAPSPEPAPGPSSGPGPLPPSPETPSPESVMPAGGMPVI